MNDPRSFPVTFLQADADWPSRRGAGRVREDHQRMTELQAIAMMQIAFGFSALVHKAPIRALQVDQFEALFGPTDLGMATRDFRIMEHDLISTVPSNRDHVTSKFESTSLVVALNYK